MGKRSPEPDAAALEHTPEQWRFFHARARWTAAIVEAINGNHRPPAGFMADTYSLVKWLGREPGLSSTPIRKVYRAVKEFERTGRPRADLEALADEAMMILQIAEARADEAPEAATTPAVMLTLADIAAKLGMALATIEKRPHRDLLGAPDEPHSGRKPARWCANNPAIVALFASRGVST